MPALAKPPAVLPRFVPHGNHGADAGAGLFSRDKLKIQPDSLDRLAHDARNILSGLTLYCELLAAPGVLAKQHRHYAQELESITKSTAQIVERMATAHNSTAAEPALPIASSVPLRSAPVIDAAEELHHLRPLLTAIAGPAIRLSIAIMPCAGRTALAVEDLTRILVNLARNAADAMPAGGYIRITAQYGDGLSFLDDARAAYGPPRSVQLTVTDDGPGIPEQLRERIFDLGFTTCKTTGSWPTPRRRGVGLSIVRNLAEAAGGTVRVVTNPGRGARFEINLPLCEAVTSGTYAMPPGQTFAADSSAGSCIKCQ